MDPDAASTERRQRFEATALPFTRVLYGVAVRLAGNTEDASDVVQETFLRAYRTFGNFTPGTNLKAWLFTILYSVLANRHRKRQREPRLVIVESIDERFARDVEAASSGPLGEPTDEEVSRALDRLPEEFRATVLLVDVEGLTYEEASVVLGCPVGTVRSRLFRARKVLFVELCDYARRAGYRKGS